MTEQQIDAEVCRYEPLHACGLIGTYSWWLFNGLLPTYAGDRSDVPAPLFAHLTARDSVSSSGTRYYPTREAAFADLRQAIAATSTNAGS